ncbi:MAG: helix-turn-helix transcriptional regulator [Verrucomicrobia bacterium]|nr:helix-turn-helix transcriptional regulator [Verrucomicrobiota bacterium]
MSTRDISPEFSRLVRERRLERKISQEKLAELAAIHPTHVGLIERGLRNPSIRVAQKIAVALGIRLSELIRQAESQSL